MGCCDTAQECSARGEGELALVRGWRVEDFGVGLVRRWHLVSAFSGRDAEVGDGKESCAPQLRLRALRRNGWGRDTAGFSITLFSERYLCCVGVSKACNVCEWKRSEEEQI